MSRFKKDRKFLDEVRDVMRLHHYLIHTERTYCGWIKLYIQYHLTLKGTRFGYNFYELISRRPEAQGFLTDEDVFKAIS